MSQLSQDQINAIIEGIKANQYVRDRKSHAWVTENGAYDYGAHCLRMFMWDGFCYLSASKMWVDDQEKNKRLPEWMRAPWGTYPELPAKPPKK